MPVQLVLDNFSALKELSKRYKQLFGCVPSFVRRIIDAFHG